MRFNKTNSAKNSTHPAPFRVSLKVLTQIFLLFTTCIILYSCKKNDFEKKPQPEPITSKDNIQKILESDFFVQNRKVADMAETNTSLLGLQTESGSSEYPDEVPMVLGGQLPNPYSIPVMTEAYNTYYASNLISVLVTDLYVKFSPVNEAQFTLLEDSLDLDLYDYPLDYEVITDGDYYAQPGKGLEDMPEFYTTVPVGFQFPSGIPYTILEQLHFPHNDIILEALAESIAAGAQYSSLHPNSGSPEVLMTRENNDSQLMNMNECFCDPTPQQLQCIPPDPNCGGGDPGPGGPGGPGGNPTPPSAQPAGGIQVFDTQLGNLPLENVRVIAKRGLRRRETYTNAQGFFVTPLHFTGRVKMHLKYRNATVSVRPLRNQLRIRLSLKVVKQHMGNYNPPLNNINFVVTRPNSRSSKAFGYWMAAHVINARNYQWQQGTIDKVKPSTKNRICYYLSNAGMGDATGMHFDAPMLRYINNGFTWDDVLDIAKIALYAAKVYKGNAVALVQGVNSLIKLVFQGQRPDIILYYNTPELNLSSNEVNQKIYASLTIAGAFENRTKNGINDWKSYLKTTDKRLSTFFAVPTGYDILKKYFGALSNPSYVESQSVFTWVGDITAIATTFATVISHINVEMTKADHQLFVMLNGFSDYYGHILSDRRYGSINSSPIIDQKRVEVFSAGGISSHIRYSENWDPNIGADPYRLNRLGVFHDLRDNVVDNVQLNGVLDNVSGISLEAQFNALTGSRFGNPIDQWNEFRLKMMDDYFGQQTAIQTLFGSYNVQ